MRVNAKLAVSITALLLAGGAPGDISLPFTPPPTPMARTVDVPEGGRVDIPLSLTSAPSGRAFEFVIRVPPTKGRLDPVRNSVGGETAQVTYTHNPALGGGRDQFTFAVQRPGGGPSSSATVDIRISEVPPRLLVLPALLDFGAQPLEGPPQRAQFTLVNQGGGVAAGRISLQPPFQLEGDDTYRLARGQRKNFSVLFQAPRASVFEGEVRFGGSFDQVLRLTGSGLAPERPPAAVTPAVTPSPAISGRLELEDVGKRPETGPSLAPSAPTPTPIPEEPPAEDAVPGFGDELLVPNFPGGSQPLRNFQLARDEQGAVTASCAAPADGAGLTYRLEQREILLDATRQLRARWKTVGSAAPTRIEQRLFWRAIPLPGGKTATLRVVAVGSDGELRGYSAFASVDVPPGRSSWGWLVFVALALAVSGGLWWRRR